MADTAQMKRARNLARDRGHLLTKLPDRFVPNDSVDVVECSVHGGECAATREDLDHGHWRSHSTVFSGDLGEVEAWLSRQER